MQSRRSAFQIAAVLGRLGRLGLLGSLALGGCAGDILDAPGSAPWNPEQPVDRRSQPRDPTSGTPGWSLPDPKLPPPPADANGLADRVGGTFALRRLTRSEYDNTIRDLLGDASRPGQTLAPDEEVGGFAANSASHIPPILIEQYRLAAQILAADAAKNLGKLLPCQPASVSEEDACAKNFIESFGLRAFRRPLAPEEGQDLLENVYREKRARSDFLPAIQLVITAMLQSPNFLYRLELGTPLTNEPQVTQLDGYELASRLSYLFWNTMPDDALFEAAALGGLARPEGLAEQVNRLLASDRVKESLARFHLQWLHLQDLERLQKHDKFNTALTPDVRSAANQETTRFIEEVFASEQGRLETLLSAGYSFVSRPLAALYGTTGAPANGIGRVEMPPGQRFGLLTQVSFLASHSDFDQSSPILRGKAVREQLLCHEIPQPSVEVEPPKPDPKLTTRARFDAHVNDPMCASCHNLIDPIGAGFERFDAIGRYRTQENGQPIKTNGSIVGGEDATGPFQDMPELAERLARSEIVRRCVARSWLRYALGRQEDPTADAHAIKSLIEGFAKNGYRVQDLLKTLPTLEAFRFNRVL
jgi:hypothetical protein